MGDGDFPETKRHADAGVHMGCPYSAVGMHKALHAAIGLPKSSTREPRMLAFVMPPEVRRSFIVAGVWIATLNT
jgi:hypothetical protein